MVEKTLRSAGTLAGRQPTEKSLLGYWATAVKARDGHRCQVCGAVDRLHAHHIKPRHLAPDLALDIDNGQTLCIPCHAAAHGGRIGKIILSFPLSRNRAQRRSSLKVAQPAVEPMSADAFEAWLGNMGITAREAARLLDVKPNTITRYRKNGGPKMLALACAALFHRLGGWHD